MTLEDKKAGLLRRKKKEKIRKISLYSVLIVLFIGLIGYGAYSASTPGELDEFAQCISDSGAVFYGASWCPFCNQQKQMFGKSQKYLPYVECSDGRSNSISQYCREQALTEPRDGVPMWVHNDTKYNGLQRLDQLAEITGCEII